MTKCGLAEGNVWPAAAATGLAEELAEQGYTPNSVEQHLRLLAQLGRWLDAEGLTPEQLTSADIGRFVELRRWKGYVAWRSLRGLAPAVRQNTVRADRHARRLGPRHHNRARASRKKP